MEQEDGAMVSREPEGTEMLVFKGHGISAWKDELFQRQGTVTIVQQHEFM